MYITSVLHCKPLLLAPPHRNFRYPLKKNILHPRAVLAPGEPVINRPLEDRYLLLPPPTYLFRTLTELKINSKLQVKILPHSSQSQNNYYFLMAGFQKQIASISLLEVMGFKPRTAGWEALTLPLCSATAKLNYWLSMAASIN